MYDAYLMALPLRQAALRSSSALSCVLVFLSPFRSAPWRSLCLPRLHGHLLAFCALLERSPAPCGRAMHGRAMHEGFSCRMRY